MNVRTPVAGVPVLGAGALAVAAAFVGVLVTSAAATTSPWLLLLLPLGLVAAGLAYRTSLRAVAVVLLFAPVALRSGVGPLHVGQVMGLLAVGVVVVVRLGRGRTALPLPRALLWAVALLAVALLSSGRTVSVGDTVRQDFALVVGLGLCAAVVAVCADLAGWLVLVRCLLVGGVAVCVPALLTGSQLQASFGGAVVADRAQGVFSQPNELGAFAMLVSLVALGLLLGARTRADQALGLVAAASGVGALLLSLSRGAWIGFTLGVLALLLVVPRARRLVAATAGVLVLLAALLGAFAPEAAQVTVVTDRLGSLTGMSVNPYDDRPRIWAEGRREVLDRPLLGQGPGAFPVASERSVSEARTVGAAHAHDVLLTVAAETGLLGAACVVGLTLACARRGWQALCATRDPLLLGVLGGVSAALVGLVGEGLVDFTLRNPLVEQTVWAVLGLLLAGAALARRAPD